MQGGKKEQLTPRDKDKDKGDKVKVILRIRPFFNYQEEQQFITVQNNYSIAVNKPGMTSFMKFSYVQNLSHTVDSADSQKDILISVEQSIRCIFQGIDSTIFAYGQTGAGKTYTIIGNCPQNNSDAQFYKQTLCSIERGILPRALEIIFDQHKKKKNSRITISFFEIYNQKIFDLLSSGMTPLQIRESKSGQITILGLTNIEVINLKEGITYLAQGIKNRATSSTSVNIKSSRSHSIFHLKYEKLVFNPETKQHQVVTANLRIVDLAGSQKFNISTDLPQSEKELKLLQLKSINGSLSKLGHCISALTVQSRTHIPVRDSKLTRILSQSLIGSGKIRLIICISPSIASMNETSSTLQFADRVKKAIFERPTSANESKKRSIDIQQLQKLQQQLSLQKQKRQTLQRMLNQLRLNPNEISLLRQNQKLKQEISQMKQQLKVFNQQDKINSSRIKQHSPSPYRKSISPYSSNYVNKNVNAKRNSVSPFNGKVGSIIVLKQDVADGVGEKKVNRTSNKVSGTKSSKDYDSKSIRYSIDEPQNKNQKKMSKAPGFDRKIKQFMEKPEIDGDLDQKVKKKLKLIKQEISMGNRQWLQSQDLTQEAKLWK